MKKCCLKGHWNPSKLWVKWWHIFEQFFILLITMQTQKFNGRPKIPIKTIREWKKSQNIVQKATETCSNYKWKVTIFWDTFWLFTSIKGHMWWLTMDDSQKLNGDVRHFARATWEDKDKKFGIEFLPAFLYRNLCFGALRSWNYYHPKLNKIQKKYVIKNEGVLKCVIESYLKTCSDWL